MAIMRSPSVVSIRGGKVDILEFIITHLQYIVPGLVSACFLLVNIIQAIRCHDKEKLKEAICRIPDIIRKAEQIGLIYFTCNEEASTTTAIYKASYKKATAESLIISEYGRKFFDKYKSIFDDAIEDILNTPQKKGGSLDGISKENEER